MARSNSERYPPCDIMLKATVWTTSYIQPECRYYLAGSYRNAKPLGEAPWQFISEMSSLYERCYSCGRGTGGSLFCSSYCRSISTDSSCMPHDRQAPSTATRTPRQTAVRDPSAEQIFHFEKQSRQGNKSYDATKTAPH